MYCAKQLADAGLTLENDLLSRTEHEQALKSCIQRGGIWGWDIRPEGIGMSGGEDMAEGYKAILSLLGHPDFSTEPRVPTALPTNTNCGWPVFRPGKLPKVACALAVASVNGDPARADEMRGRLGRWAKDFGSPQEDCSIQFSRTGQTNKAIPCYKPDPSGGWIVTNGTVTGAGPRRRAVNGVSSADNYLLIKGAKRIMRWLRTSPVFNHTNHVATMSRLRTARARIGKSAILVDDDISAFDLSVRGSQQQALQRIILSDLFGADWAHAWLQTQWLPLLSPPIFPEGNATLYRKLKGGETTSGMITTSTDGCLHNLACFLICYSHAVKQPIETTVTQIKSEELCLLIWGDDTAFVTDSRRFSLSRYSERAAELGYTRKPRASTSSATFLARFYDVINNVSYPIMARVLQNTMLREHPSPGPAMEMLGLYFRWHFLGANAHPLADYAWHLLQRDPGSALKRFGIATREQLGQVIERQDILSTAKTELLSAGRGAQSWATQNRTDPERDPATAALLAYVANRITPEGIVSMTGLSDDSIDEDRAAGMLSELMEYILTPPDLRDAAPRWATAWL